MARTFWGNMLELLAATGLNTAAKIGANAITAPIQAKQASQQQVLRSLLPVLSTGSESEREAVAKTIQDLSGVTLPRAEVPLPTTRSLEGTMLPVPTMEGISEEFNPTRQALVKPPVGMDQLLGQMVGKMSGEQQAQLLGLKLGTTPKPLDVLKLGLAERREGRMANQFQQNQIRMEQMQRENLDWRKSMGESLIENRRMAIQSQLLNQQILHQLAGDRLEAGARAQLDKSLSNLNKLYQDPTTKPAVLEKAVGDYNKLHGAVIAKHPDLANFFTPMNIKMEGLIFKTPKLESGASETATKTTLSQDVLDQFSVAYKTNPELAIRNAKRLGYYDQLKAAGVIK